MPNSIRWLLRGVKGRVRANFNWPGVISALSVVQITAGEVHFGSSQVQTMQPLQDFGYVLGDADVWVSNISPHRNDYRGDPGGVSFILHVDWESPLDVVVTITVEDAIPVEIQGYTVGGLGKDWR
jgi:hypothetical protein